MVMIKFAVLLGASVLTMSACSGSDDGRVASGPDGSPPPTTHSSDAQPTAARFPPSTKCPRVTPNELPNGRHPGARRDYPIERFTRFLDVWGHGKNRVVIGRGQEVVDHYGGKDEERAFPRPGERAAGQDGIRRWVIAIGDPPLGQIAYKYLLGECPYLIWTHSGLTWRQALQYASRLATPRASNGRPLTVLIETLNRAGVRSVGEAEPAHGASFRILCGRFADTRVCATVSRGGSALLEGRTEVRRSEQNGVLLRVLRDDEGQYVHLRSRGFHWLLFGESRSPDAPPIPVLVDLAEAICCR